MKSFTAATFTTLLFAAATNAQEQYRIDPNNVNLTTREYWCTQNEAQCPLICLQTVTNNDATTEANTCDPVQLTYACVCSDGTSPNISEYSQTLPFFICQEWGNECVANCADNDSTCQTNCRTQHPCGAQHPVLAKNSTSTTSAAQGQTTQSAMEGGATTVMSDGQTRVAYTSALGGGSNGGSGSGSTSGAATRFRGWALGAGQTFGGLALVGAIFGGFAVLL